MANNEGDNNNGGGFNRHLEAVEGKEIVFCHMCNSQWYRDQHGLICPVCEGEITEIVCYLPMEDIGILMMYRCLLNQIHDRDRECLRRRKSVIYDSIIHFILMQMIRIRKRQISMSMLDILRADIIFRGRRIVIALYGRLRIGDELGRRTMSWVIFRV
jgi:hypothetical protein